MTNAFVVLHFDVHAVLTHVSGAVSKQSERSRDEFRKTFETTLEQDGWKSVMLYTTFSKAFGSVPTHASVLAAVVAMARVVGKEFRDEEWWRGTTLDVMLNVLGTDEVPSVQRVSIPR